MLTKRYLILDYTEGRCGHFDDGGTTGS